MPPCGPVVQGPVRTPVLGLTDHRKDGGDSDSGCDEQIAVRPVQTEVVARSFDPQLLTGPQEGVHVLRAAATRSFAPNSYLVDGSVVDWSAQRVLTFDAGRQN